MGRAKITSLIALTVLFAVTASGLLYEVEVGDSLNQSNYELNYSQEIEDVQEISIILDNTGSVGCQFRLRNEMKAENFSRTDYSQSYSVWPGNSALMEVRSVPENVTGEINSTLYASYCGKTEEIAEFGFNDTEKTVLNDSIESKTLAAENGGVKISVPVQEGVIVPVDEPAYWKVGSAQLNSGRATADLEAPIFNAEQSVEFAVINESTGRTVGTTSVEMTAEEDLLYRIEQNFLEIVLGISLLVNVVLASRFFRQLIK